VPGRERAAQIRSTDAETSHRTRLNDHYLFLSRRGADDLRRPKIQAQYADEIKAQAEQGRY
jgi:hypothetical protein